MATLRFYETWNIKHEIYKYGRNYDLEDCLPSIILIRGMGEQIPRLRNIPLSHIRYLNICI